MEGPVIAVFVFILLILLFVLLLVKMKSWEKTRPVRRIVPRTKEDTAYIRKNFHFWSIVFQNLGAFSLAFVLVEPVWCKFFSSLFMIFLGYALFTLEHRE